MPRTCGALASYRSHIRAAWQQVGNFRVEPPGLFRGRGEHPKMGMIKARAALSRAVQLPRRIHGFVRLHCLGAASHSSRGHRHQHWQRGDCSCATGWPPVEGCHSQPVCVMASRLEGQHQYEGLEVRLSFCALQPNMCSCVVRPCRYVQLGATSMIKGESDQRKYEKVCAFAHQNGKPSC